MLPSVVSTVGKVKQRECRPSMVRPKLDIWRVGHLAQATKNKVGRAALSCTLLAMTSPSSANIFDKDQIDIRMLLIALWKRKFWIIAGALVATSVSGYYAFKVAVPVYESTAVLIPTEAPVKNQLGAAAALLGKTSNSNVDAELYQSLLTSRTVLHKLLSASIVNGSDTAKGRIEPLSKTLQLDTSRLGAIEATIKALASAIHVGSMERGDGGILEIKFRSREPWLAQQIGNSLLGIGQEELGLVRAERSKLIGSRLIPAVEKSQLEWDSATKRVTYFKDINRSITLPDQVMQLARLEIEKSAKEQKYLLVRKEFELQQLEAIKAVPPMMVLDPPNYPGRESKPNRRIIVLLGAIFGLAFSSSVVAAKCLFDESFRHNR
jgi:uncharacterized protein involved in exopolysaccharide biosynthesis